MNEWMNEWMEWNGMEWNGMEWNGMVSSVDVENDCNVTVWWKEVEKSKC